MSREPAEVQQALSTVSQALTRLKEHKRVTWLLDSGFDDIAVWRTIWEQQEHVVARLYHTDRKVTFQDRQGQWIEGDIAQATAALRPLARVETSLQVKRGEQVRPKQQPVPVDLAACPLRVTYWTNVRRQGQVVNGANVRRFLSRNVGIRRECWESCLGCLRKPL